MMEHAPTCRNSLVKNGFFLATHANRMSKPEEGCLLVLPGEWICLRIPNGNPSLSLQITSNTWASGPHMSSFLAWAAGLQSQQLLAQNQQLLVQSQQLLVQGLFALIQQRLGNKVARPLQLS